MASQAHLEVEYRTVDEIMERARLLPGMTFREVLRLGIAPEGAVTEYNSRRYKGGMGTLIEERFFGYRANSDREPDFSEAGVELKATCIDRRKDGREVAGERLVLTMIPYDEEAPESLYDSHLWHKCARMLIVWYRRDRSIDPYDQRIAFAYLYEPPEADLLLESISISPIGTAVEKLDRFRPYNASSSKSWPSMPSSMESASRSNALARFRTTEASHACDTSSSRAMDERTRNLEPSPGYGSAPDAGTSLKSR